MTEPNNPRKTLFTGEFLSLIREGHWEYVQRVNSTGAAIIVAVTPERKLVLVEQYRIPCHARTLEMPAGIVGDEPGTGDESHIEAARRELLEETGYAAAEIKPVVTGAASAGLAGELVTLFVATGLRREGTGGGIGHERIKVHEVPLEGIDEWLRHKAAEGMLVDPKIYAGLYFVTRR